MTDVLVGFFFSKICQTIMTNNWRTEKTKKTFFLLRISWKNAYAFAYELIDTHKEKEKEKKKKTEIHTRASTNTIITKQKLEQISENREDELYQCKKRSVINTRTHRQTDTHTKRKEKKKLYLQLKMKKK